MNDLRAQILKATNDFLTAIRRLTHQHAASLLEETSSSLSDGRRAATADRSRGAKRGADELDQLSQRFTQFVRDNPGLRIEQINKQMGTTTAELALPIRKLVASGAVTVEGERRATTYFAAEIGKKGGAPSAAPAPAAGRSTKRQTRAKKGRAKSKSKKTA